MAPRARGVAVEIESSRSKERPASHSSQSSEAEEGHHASQDEQLKQELRTVSLGALADAQASLGPTKLSRATNSTVPSSSDKVATLRARLADLRKLKEQKGQKRKRDSDIEDAEASDSDSGPEDASTKHAHGRQDHSRSSKHAPTSQSSKYAVPRARTVIDLPPLDNPYHSRDPRFSSLSGRVNDEKLKRDYAFLSGYREQELDALKESMRNAKRNGASAEEVEELKREIGAVENRMKAERDKEREQDVVKKHRKEERELVKQGKKPFYLKRGDVKKKATEEKWSGMKAKERDKALRRRKTREGQKEKRKMPNFARAEKLSNG